MTLKGVLGSVALTLCFAASVFGAWALDRVVSPETVAIIGVSFVASTFVYLGWMLTR